MITDEQIEEIVKTIPDLYKKTFNITGSKDDTDVGVLSEIIGGEISQYMIRENSASITSESDMRHSAMMGILIGVEWQKKQNKQDAVSFAMWLYNDGEQPCWFTKIDTNIWQHKTTCVFYNASQLHQYWLDNVKGK